ncbi:MAG: hypothetical protein WCP74_08015 [Sphingobacteriia bacterium]|jgi:hypothetical protein
MKKVFGLLTIALCCSLTTLIAQPPAGGGGGGQMTPEQRTAMMKERYKGMGCNDVQCDSLIAITNDMRPKQMALRDVPEADRPAKMKEITDERNKRIEKALPADLAKKVIEAMSQQRPGGGRGGGI